MIKFTLVLIVLSSYCICLSQNRMDITFVLDKSIDPIDLNINLDDGINYHSLNDSLGKSTFNVTNSYYGYYSHISISSKQNGLTFEYFINDRPGKFILNIDTIEVAESLKVSHSKDIINSLDSIENPIRLEYESFLKNDPDHIAIIKIITNYSNEINKNDSIRNILTEHTKLFNKKLFKLIEKRKDDYYSFYMFKNYSKMQLNGMENEVDEVASLIQQLNSFPKKYTNTKEGKILHEEFQNKTIPLEERNLVNFTDVEGIKYTIENLKSEYILLDFWATWCAPCMAQIPEIKNLNKQYSLEKLQIIGISADTDSANFSRVIEEEKMNWIHIFDKNKDATRQFNIRAYPTLILIDKAGKIIFRAEGIMNKKRIIDIIEGKK